MTNLRKAAQMALDALESVFEGDDKGAEYWTVTGGTYEAVECMNAMRALRAALAQPEQEPVAWLYTNKLGGRQVSLIEPLPSLKDQYQPLYTIPPQVNAFNPDWDAIPVMVEEQQRMAKRIEELESQLGEAMWGYGEWRRKAEALEQANHHNIRPLYTAPPQREWVGLTDEERDELCLGDEAIARAIEAKLKEKNGA